MKPKLTKIKLWSIIKNSCEAKSNELGYLAVTSKPEHTIRDRIAWRLYKELKKSNKPLTVSREWKRTDIAVLHGNEPKLIIEFKAGYIYDSHTVRKKPGHGDYAIDLFSDKEKRSSFLGIGAKLYLVLFMVDCLQNPSSTHENGFHYRSGIRRLNKKSDTSRTSQIGKIKSNIEEKLLQKPLHHEVNLGSPYGVKTKLHIWFIGPIRNDVQTI